MHIEKSFVSVYDNELLYGVWEIYQMSFPKTEMRTLSNLRKAIQGEFCKVVAYHDMGSVIGFLIFWEYPNFTYLEFFAVALDMRNGGYGAYIIRDFVSEFKHKPIVLEIDNICDEISERRYHFYSREGFVLNDFKHTPSAYNNKDVKLDMHIMTYKNKLTPNEYEEFNTILNSDIMANLYEE